MKKNRFIQLMASILIISPLALFIGDFATIKNVFEESLEK